MHTYYNTTGTERTKIPKAGSFHDQVFKLLTRLPRIHRPAPPCSVKQRGLPPRRRARAPTQGELAATSIRKAVAPCTDWRLFMECRSPVGARQEGAQHPAEGNGDKRTTQPAGVSLKRRRGPSAATGIHGLRGHGNAQ